MLHQGKVDKVDAKVGRVFVKVNPYKEQVLAIGFPDVSTAPLGEPSKK